MATPKWLTPAGFLGTLTERISTSTSVSADGTDTTYRLISGTLPTGLKFNSIGTITGTPFSVEETSSTQFVIRAQNSSGITDRTFILNIAGPTAPSWITPNGYLPLSITGDQLYVINKEYIDFQFSSTASDILIPGNSLKYSIEPQEGELPPGLTLSESGRLTGYIHDTTMYTDSGYDGGDPYDHYPYDSYSFPSELGIEQRTNGLFNVYKFYVTVTDGFASSKRLFKIWIEDPQTLRADTTVIRSDMTEYTADSSWLIAPEWMTPTDMHVLRANDYQVIQLETFDPYYYTGPTTYEWIGPPLPNFNLTTSTGVLHALLPYDNIYTQTYSFSIRAVKHDSNSTATSYSDRQFNVIVRGDVENEIIFVTGSDLGTIEVGYQSELQVVAIHTMEPLEIQYELVSGSLPSGLYVANNGIIIGTVNYDTGTTFDEDLYGFGEFTLDDSLTTIDDVYSFTIAATDIYPGNMVLKTFNIKVKKIDTVEYTKIYAMPFLKSDQRALYTDFINNRNIFSNELMYRANDPSFGVQSKIKMYLEYGIEVLDLCEYFNTFREYFYNKKLYFGNVATKEARDDSGNYVYDIVYVEIVDNLINNDGVSLVGSEDMIYTIVYPNSIANMRTAVESMEIFDVQIRVDNARIPRYMKTIQVGAGAPLGYILNVPLCYALPGNGIVIKKLIDDSNFNFKVLDFEIDRLVIENNMLVPGEQYIRFPRKVNTDPIPNLEFECEDVLITEDGDRIITPHGSNLRIDYDQVLDTESELIIYTENDLIVYI